MGQYKIENSNLHVIIGTSNQYKSLTFQEFDSNNDPTVNDDFTNGASLNIYKTVINNVNGTSVIFDSKIFASPTQYVEYSQNGTTTFSSEGACAQLKIKLNGTLDSGNYILIDVV